MVTCSTSYSGEPVFVLAYNLARPGTFERGAYPRTMKRLALFGAVASVPFIALGGLFAGWWPLNVLFTLLVGGSSVEYWWPAAILGLAVWSYCKRPTWSAAVIALLALASLWFINRNLWALAAVPLLLVASRLDLPMPRLRWAFYAYYPLHLAALWLIRIPMSKAGYLFF